MAMNMAMNMAPNIETWPDVLGLSGRGGAAFFAGELDGLEDDFAVEDDAQDAAFLEFEDDPMLLEDRPGGLSIGGVRPSLVAVSPVEAKAEVAASAAAVTANAAPGVKIKKRRRPRLKPPEKSIAEMAANARRFHAWQRGEREAPAFWDVTDGWVQVRP